MVTDLELEVQGRRWWRNHDEHAEGSVSMRHNHGEASHQSSSHRSWDYIDRDLATPEKRRPRNVALDAMSQALRRAGQSPFSEEIEWAPMPSKFTKPPFISYDGKIDSVEHVSHYILMMSLHSQNDALMCKVFPSSLGPTTLRWLNGLRKGSIHNFGELILLGYMWINVRNICQYRIG